MKELSPFYIFRAQWRATYNFEGHEKEDTRHHNIFSVLFLIIVPSCSVVGSLCIYFVPIFMSKNHDFGVKPVAISDTLLASLAILAGALITAFSLLASWRSSVSSANEDFEECGPERWLLDTSAAHLLAGSYSSIVAAVVAVFTKLLAPIDNNVVQQICNSLTIGFSAHVVVSLLIALPGLYAAYVQLNDVDDVLNSQKDL